MPMPVNISCAHPFKGGAVTLNASVDKDGKVGSGICLNGRDMSRNEVKQLIKVLKKAVEHLDGLEAAASAQYQLAEE